MATSRGGEGELADARGKFPDVPYNQVKVVPLAAHRCCYRFRDWG
jgi:hypothetical protein